MKTDFLGSAYQSRSLPLAGQTLVNLFHEPAPPGSAEQGMFYGSPGLRLLATLGAGPIRALHTTDALGWAVSGSELYQFTASGVATLIGTVPGSGRVCLVHNDTQLIVMHSEGWHVAVPATGAYAAVTDAPTTAQGTYQDGYAVFPNEDGTYGWTQVGDATALDALSFSSAETQPDPVIAVLSDHRELWAFGSATVEIMQTSTDPDAPFVRTAMVEYGCAAKYSPAKSDNTVFWLGRNESGQGCVYRAEGYSPARISTYALETALAGYGDLSDAFGYCYQQNGHTFYVLTIPGHATWAFDVGTQRWTQLAYRHPSSGALEPHRGNAYAFLQGMHLVGDRDNGHVYVLDLDTYTDHGDPIVRERAWSVIEAEGRWIRHDRLQMMAEMGVGLDGGAFPGEADVTIATVGADPHVLLDWSDTGCKTWSHTRTLPLGRLGEFRRRAQTRRLGISRNRVYRIRISEPVRVALYGVNLDAKVLTR